MEVKESVLQTAKRHALWVAMGIYAGCSVCYLFHLMMYPDFFSYSGLAIPVFIIILLSQKYFWNRQNSSLEASVKKRRLRFVIGFSFLLGLSYILGYQMSAMEMTSLGIKGKLFILVVSLGVGIAFAPLVNCWFALLDRFRQKIGKQAALTKRQKRGAFFLSWCIIFVCWIPAFLAYYPAIMSYDFHRQSQEAVLGYVWFNSHHPLIHTFLIRIFLLLGEALGSYQLGMALFSLLQMLILSAVLAYGCNMIYRLTGRKWTVWVCVLLFGLLPIHPVLALSMTKDILFTAFFLLLLLLLMELHWAGSTRAGILLFIACALTGILAMLFRNNAVYAFVIFAVFYVLFSKKARLRSLLLCIIIVLGGLGGAAGIKHAMHAGTGSKVEMYSVVIQQFARTGKLHQDSLSDEEYSKINAYVDHTYWNDYNPPLSDTVKANVAVSNFLQWKENIPKMLRDWVAVGLAYPNDYIDAFLALTSGYWFLDDVSHAEVLGYGDETNLGLLYTFNASVSNNFDGVESHSFLPGLLRLYQKIVNGNAYYQWPLVSNLFKPAFYCWMLLLVIVSFFYLKQGNKVIICLWPLTYLFTLYLGPVVNMRYVYPIVVAVPLLLAWLFSDAAWKGKTGGCKQDI